MPDHQKAAFLEKHHTHRTSNEVLHAREHLLAQVKIAKSDLLNMIEGGTRQWVELRKTLEVYIDFLTAADVLAGYEAVVPVSPAPKNAPRPSPRGGGELIEVCTWPNCSCPDGANAPRRTCVVIGRMPT